VSGACFIVQGVLVCGPSLETPPGAHCLLAALLVAVLATGLEAVSPRGSDNLLVPLGVLLVLPPLLEMSLPELVQQAFELTVVGLLISQATGHQ